MNRVMRAEAEVKAERPFKVLVPALVILAIVVAVVGALYARSGSDASQDVRESSRRADCRSAYNADLTQVIRERDDLKLDLDAQYYSATYNAAVTGQRSTPEQIAQFGTTLAALEKARAAVRALPKINDAVDRGYTLNGTHHPPCPG